MLRKPIYVVGVNQRKMPRRQATRHLFRKTQSTSRIAISSVRNWNAQRSVWIGFLLKGCDTLPDHVEGCATGTHSNSLKTAMISREINGQKSFVADRRSYVVPGPSGDSRVSGRLKPVVERAERRLEFRLQTIRLLRRRQAPTVFALIPFRKTFEFGSETEDGELSSV